MLEQERYQGYIGMVGEHIQAPNWDAALEAVHNGGFPPQTDMDEISKFKIAMRDMLRVQDPDRRWRVWNLYFAGRTDYIGFYPVGRRGEAA